MCVLDLGPEGERRGREGEIRSGSVSLLLISSLQKEEMKFQPHQEEEEEEEGAHNGIISRFLGLQSHDHQPPRTSSKTKLLLPKKEVLLPEGQPENLRGLGKSSRDQEDSKAWRLKGEEAFKSAALHRRSGSHSAPQTPLSPIPMVFPPGQPAPSSLRRVSGADSTVKDQSLQPVTPGTRNSFDSPPAFAGASGEHLELCHIERKTVEFNLTDVSEAPGSHLREPHTPSTSSIHTTLEDHHDPYWALENRCVLYPNQGQRTLSLDTSPPSPGSLAEPALLP